MTKFYAYVGGLIGSAAIANTEFSDTLLSGLTPVFDIVAPAALVIFSGALLWEGAKSLVNR